MARFATAGVRRVFPKSFDRVRIEPMPLYEYLCHDCEQEVEVLVRSSGEKPACPDCGGAKLMKLLSVPASISGSAASQSAGGDPPAGSCGSGCGCFPQG